MSFTKNTSPYYYIGTSTRFSCNTCTFYFNFYFRYECTIGKTVKYFEKLFTFFKS